MAAVSKQNVGALLKQARVARGLTQGRLAQMIGLHPLTISNAECMSWVTWRTAKRLGDALGLDPRDLVTRE